MAGLITGGTILEGKLILSLDSGEILDLGYVQGPRGLTGERGPMGATGRAGQDGNGLLHGAGVPLFDDGKDGDFYIDIKEWKAYGPKVGGKWGSGVALLPKDRDQQLPTGMRAQGGAAGARAFAAGISGPSSGGVPGGSTGDGLKTITGHGQPLLASLPAEIAVDTTGDAMKVLVWAESATGTLFVEVAASKGKGVAGFTEIYDIRMGAAPVLTFDATVVGDELHLSVTSDVDLTTIKGKVIYL